MSIIHLENIDFAYNPKEPILKQLNLEVPKSSVYGFLGTNGAGKSTTLRLLLGLMKPASGRISMFGEDISKTYPRHLSKVGSLIESASLYDHLNSKEHLKLAAKYFNISNPDISGILEKVKLDHTGKKKTKDFSTGMKQRLGLAMTLLHNPEILILDEPTNGLDPNGIIELRSIIKELNSDGKTILLSSHILSEVEKIVDRIGIIKNGSIVFEGSIEDLQRKKTENIDVHFKVSNLEKSKEILNIKEHQIIGADLFMIKMNQQEDVAKIIRSLVNNNIDVYEVSPQSNDLENMFLNVTND